MSVGYESIDPDPLLITMGDYSLLPPILGILDENSQMEKEVKSRRNVLFHSYKLHVNCKQFLYINNVCIVMHYLFFMVMFGPGFELVTQRAML
jgi:hypothetical protein